MTVNSTLNSVIRHINKRQAWALLLLLGEPVALPTPRRCLTFTSETNRKDTKMTTYSSPLRMPGSAATVSPEVIEEHLDTVYNCTCLLRNRVDALLSFEEDFASFGFGVGMAAPDLKSFGSALMGVIDAINDKVKQLEELTAR